MPTNIPIATRHTKVAGIKNSSMLFSDEFFAIALFSGIGLLLSLIAIICDQQGIWF
jgi:hypothetical protein